MLVVFLLASQHILLFSQQILQIKLSLLIINN